MTESLNAATSQCVYGTPPHRAPIGWESLNRIKLFWTEAGDWPRVWTEFKLYLSIYPGVNLAFQISHREVNGSLIRRWRLKSCQIVHRSGWHVKEMLFFRWNYSKFCYVQLKFLSYIWVKLIGLNVVLQIYK